MTNDELKDALESRARTGLDLSPGDEVSQEALNRIEGLETALAIVKTLLKEPETI